MEDEGWERPRCGGLSITDGGWRRMFPVEGKVFVECDGGLKSSGMSWQGLARVNGTDMAVVVRRANHCWSQIMVILYIRLGILNLICSHGRNIKVF